MLIQAESGKSALLRLGLKDGDTAKFPQAEIYNSADGLVATHDLAHVPGSSGLYHVYIPAPSKGDYTIRYKVYTTIGHTTLASYELESDGLRVHSVWDENLEDHILASSFGHAFLAVSGHSGGYYVRDDALTYDGNDRPTSFRRRLFLTQLDLDNSTYNGTGEGEALTITATAAHFSASQWKSLLRVLS